MADSEDAPRFVKSSDEAGFVDPPDDGEEFVTDTPKGAVKRTPANESRDRDYRSYRTTEPPKEKIEERRALYNQDPHVGDSIEIVLDWLLADSWNISPRNVSNTDDSMDPEKVAQLRRMMVNSNFNRVFNSWVEKAAEEGHAFMELLVTEEGKFKPRLLPFERLHKFTDKYGNPEEYILEPADGGGPNDDDATIYSKDEVAELYFRKGTLDDFGQALSDRAREQADMLRDMEIDYARFVASKAYPPIMWQCGSEESQWSEEQIEGWLDDVEAIQPDSMIGAPHDVEAEAVGVTSTSSSAGAMRLEETFKHHERRIVTSIGVPAVLANMDAQGSSAEAVMPAFKRRIRRYQMLIKESVEQEILKPLYVQSINGTEELADYQGLIPVFEFGEHSNAENRLEVDKLIKLFNNGFLSRTAFAERAGIDPETEMPGMDELQDEVVPTIQQLAGLGDRVQNPGGGRPTDTGSGAQSSGREATSREDATTDNSGDSDRPKQSPTEDTS